MSRSTPVDTRHRRVSRAAGPHGVEWLRPRARLRAAAAIALCSGAVAACDRPVVVVPTSYLAVVTALDDPTAGGRVRFAYRVRELSGTFPVDTTLTVTVRDTVILPLEPATYAVVLDSLPPTCSARQGSEQYVVVAPPPSTAIARYFILCRTALSVRVATDGFAVDSQFIYRLGGPGSARDGLIGATDTLDFDELAPGAWTVTLGHVSQNCVITSDGGSRQTVTVPPEGGATVDFRVACSDEARRPRLLSFAAGYRDGAAAFVLRAADPDRDIERYSFDLTDCAGTSLLPGGARLRRGLTAGRTARADTVTIIGAFDVGLPDSVARRGCAAVRVADEYGNTTPVTERRLTAAAGAPPMATSFNATYVGTSAVRTQLAAFDADGDLAGIFAAATLRDGILSPPDGRPDVGIFNAAGYLATPLPDLPLSARVAWGDVLSIIVYLVDDRGNLVRLEDADLFR